VTNGTLTVAADNGLGNSTNVTVLGGTLELKTQYGIADTASLSISNGQVKIAAGLTESVGKLFINGVQQASGTWGSTASGATHTDDTHFSGNGKIYVMSAPPVSVTEATWNGEGADTLLNTAANWQGGTAPVFDGTLRAIFGTGGTTATVNTAANLYGITFNRAGSFTLADGDGALTLGAGGITAASPDTASRIYAITEEITLKANSTWHVATNGAGVTTLAVSNAIHDDGSDPYGFTKTGAGKLTLSGDSTYDGATIVNEGSLCVTHPNALGSTNGPTVIEDGAWIEMSGGITVGEPLSLPSDKSTGFGGGLRSMGGGNVWAGEIITSPIGSRITCYAGSLDITGGITGSSSICLSGSGSGSLRVSGAPINIPGKWLFLHSSTPIILAVTNNAWSILFIRSNFVRTDLDDVLPPSSSLLFEAVNNTGLDLNGHNQTVGKLTAQENTGLNMALCSPTPATLTVNQTESTVFHASITGAVTLVKSGSGTLTLARACTTSGDFVVSNGTLAVSATGSLGENSTNIWVAGGTLSLANSAAVSDSAALRIADGGAKVNLLAGVNETVGWLYLGDKMQRAGTYGSTSSTATYKDDAYFSGTGILRVLHDKAGTLIKVR
jgi:autotransporter-associated beta strand protein